MKKVFEFIKELRKKPYGKAVLFFGFYLIFFIVILLVLNLNGIKDDEETEKITGLNIQYIKRYNYAFKYKVVLDDSTYNYEGNKDNSTFNYTYNGKEYYYQNSKSYNKGETTEIDNPIKFYKLFDESITSELLKVAYIESKTMYNTGDVGYGLLLSSNTLNKVLDDKDTDVDEIPNKIKVTLGTNNFVKEINYNLDSYCKSNNTCKKLDITISYDEFSPRS